MKKEKSCGAIIIYNNQVLLIKQHQGFWGFPKGHVELGETEVETAIREVKEETNVDIAVDESLRLPITYEIKDDDVLQTVIYFVARPIGEFIEIAQESEVLEMKWVDMDKVEETLTFHNMKKLWNLVYSEIIKKK